jgi:hypothetical protein
MRTKIFVMFRSNGLGSGGGAPMKEAHELKLSDKEFERKIMTNEKIMGELKKRCNGIEFVGDISVTSIESAISKVENLPGDIDGIVIFGPLSEVVIFSPLSGGHSFGSPLTDKLIKTNLPIIVVFPLWGMWQESFTYQDYKGKKILTSHISILRDDSERVFSWRFEDLVKKIKLISALSKMRGFKILSVTDTPPLGGYTPRFGNTKEYEKTCVNNLKNIFGVELTTTSQEELFTQVGKIHENEKDKAEQIVKKWIEEAEDVKWDEVTREDILKSAEVYLAMKELRDKYNCDTITTEGYGIFAGYKKGAIPCQGLASTQLSTEGPIAAPSETLLYSLMIQQLGLNMTGRNGFNGDYIIDYFNQVAYIGHCEGPLNPYGDERMCPYIIRNLPQHYKNQCGASVQIKYPLDEIVTAIGMSIYDKKISVFTGKTISGRSLFEDFDNIYCRSKIAIKTDAKALLKNVNWEIFNQHRVVFYGDFREEFKDLATLIEFDILEEDK